MPRGTSNIWCSSYWNSHHISRYSEVGGNSNQNLSCRLFIFMLWGEGKCSFNGATLSCDYPEQNEQVGISSIRCDNLPGVSSCKQSCKSTDDDSCKDFGLNIVIPRSRRHWSMLLSRYPRSTSGLFHYNTRHYETIQQRHCL